jgi:hypothetical protein
MERQLQEDVYSYLAEAKVNVDVLFGGDDKTGLIVNVRLRPWKNNARQGVMILVASYDADSAMLLAVRALNAVRWVPLDWAARTATFGVYSPAVLGAAAPAGPGRALLDHRLFSSPDEDDTKDDESNEAYNGVGERADENGEIVPINRKK